MAENEELNEDPQGEKTIEELDAELEAEAAKFQEAPEEVADEEEAPAEAPKAEAKPSMSDEEAQEVIRTAAKQYGWQIVVPGEVDAEKAAAKEEAKSDQAIDLLEGLSDVEVPQEVIDEIDARFPGEHNARKREQLYISAAMKEQVRQEAEAQAQRAVAPLAEERQNAMWEAKAQATAKDIVTKAEVPEALEAVAEIIRKAGPGSEERYKTDEDFREGINARIKLKILEIQDSLGSQEQKPLPTAERVGGGKGEAVASMDTLTGEAKAMAAEYKKDLANNLITKAEYDSFMKDLQKESARQ